MPPKRKFLTLVERVKVIELNQLCLNWFQDATNRRMPIRGPLIQQQALKFVRDMNNDTFNAFNGWLDSFLKRNNIAKL